MRLRRSLGSLAVLPLLVLAACAPQEDESAEPTASDSPSTEASASASADAAVDAACGPDDAALKTAGQLTIGTDSPAYDPWFKDDDPTNGEGYESAVAYAVAEQLGFSADQVSWVTVPFNTSYKPGAKEFDFDINQISITPARAKVVDFSDGYYSAAQAIVALDGSDIASATSLADLKGYKLGAQTGTTSLTVLRDEVQPDQEPAVFEDTNAAKQALLNGQVDGIVADLPTAFYISAAEIEGSKIVGQFQPTSGDPEEFGMLFEKGSPLVSCVNDALAALTADGTLDQLQQQWLSDEVSVPVLQ
jgi:polar amino acid transport system substrate-binding protein